MAARFAEHLPRRALGNADVVAILGVVGISGALILSPDRIEDGPTICPFRLTTGLPCPGCGLTRSWVYLAHGRWTDSFTAHPFGVVAAALIVALIIVVLRSRLRRTDPPLLHPFVRRRWLLGIFAAWLTFAAGRLMFAMSG